MTDNQPSTTSWRNIPDLIDRYFNESELRDLCFKLGVDYENLEERTKKGKARELTLFARRYNILEVLIDHINKMRPHIGLNIQQEVSQRLPPNDPLLDKISDRIDELRIYHERLREWKELHDHLDMALITMGPYVSEVERSWLNSNNLDLNTLDRFWRPAHSQLEIIVAWESTKVQYINQTQYGVLGTQWSLNLKILFEANHQFLADSRRQASASVSISNSFLTFLSNQVSCKPDWQDRLQERTRDLDDMIKKLMSKTDKELRKAASDLYLHSREVLWG